MVLVVTPGKIPLFSGGTVIRGHRTKLSLPVSRAGAPALRGARGLGRQSCRLSTQKVNSQLSLYLVLLHQGLKTPGCKLCSFALLVVTVRGQPYDPLSRGREPPEMAG